MDWKSRADFWLPFPLTEVWKVKQVGLEGLLLRSEIIHQSNIEMIFIVNIMINWDEEI